MMTKDLFLLEIVWLYSRKKRYFFIYLWKEHEPPQWIFWPLIDSYDEQQRLSRTTRDWPWQTDCRIKMDQIRTNRINVDQTWINLRIFFRLPVRHVNFWKRIEVQGSVNYVWNVHFNGIWIWIKWDMSI